NSPSASEGENSYGFNERAGRLGTEDAGKIVALTYPEPVARWVDPTERQNFKTTADDTQTCLIHFGKANVVFYDGHTESLDLADFDPTEPCILKERWLPTRDPLPNDVVLPPDCEDPFASGSHTLPDADLDGIPDVSVGSDPDDFDDDGIPNAEDDYPYHDTHPENPGDDPTHSANDYCDDGQTPTTENPCADNCPDDENPDQNLSACDSSGGDDDDTGDDDTGDDDTGDDDTGDDDTGDGDSGPESCSPGVEVIVNDPSLVGDWKTAEESNISLEYNAYQGDMYWNNAGDGTATATFTPDITEPGSYNIRLWWEKHSTRSTNVPVTIHHKNGSDNITLDQRTVDGRNWQHSLGTFELDENSSVVLTNTGTGSGQFWTNYVVADAVKFECAEEGGDSGPDPCYPPTDPDGRVDLALEYLASQQRDDGSFHFNDAGGGADAPGAATGLALLAFLGNGNTPYSGTYKQNVCDAVKFLISNQILVSEGTPGGSGSCVPWEIPPGRLSAGGGELYSHLIAHWSLAEAVLLSQEAIDGDCAEMCDLTMEQMRTAATSANNYTTLAIACDGGWAYRPYWGHTNGMQSHVGDTSHHHFAMAAVVASEKAGITNNALDVMLGQNQDHLVRVGVNAITDPTIGYSSPTGYGYRYSHEQAKPRLTACGMLSCTYVYLISRDPAHAGVPASHTAIQSFFDNNSPDLQGDLYYNKPATLLAYQIGGDVWNNWIGILKPHLHATQNADGSWFFANDDSPNSNADGGKIYCTAMAVLCLEPGYAGLKLLD
ncbi:MAG TPA: hypothetical protein QF761_14770, partial [Pirellulales bacterium]|nr:hypothetical protein [Pirellulales bacterium]